MYRIKENTYNKINFLEKEGIFMAKLYRIVPDTAATLTTTGYISKITEDLLYKLNYIP